MTTQQQQDMRQLLLSNMLALGLDAGGLERKFRIPFNRDMFALPNKKGFEVVMYFLFGRLSPSMCQEQFKSCWPITDKKDEQNFRKVSRDWLQKISADDANANLPLPRIVASLFMSPGGDRIYQLLFYFSSYVLEHCIRNENVMRSHEFLQRPILNTHNKMMGDSLALFEISGIVRLRKKFLNHSQQAVIVQNEWKVYGSELLKTYRTISRDIRDREQFIKEEINLAAEKSAARGSLKSGHRKSGIPQYDFDVQSVHRAHRLRHVREMWEKLDGFLANSKVDREVLETVLEGTQDAYCIDARNLNIRIPDLLLRECEKEIQRRGVDNVYKGGKLNLVSLMHLWNLSLHLYIEKIHQIGLPKLDDVTPKVTTQCHTQQALLTNAQHLRSKLKRKAIPQLKNNIRVLRDGLDAQVFRSKSPDSIRMTSLGFGFMPPTPPVNFSGEGIDPSLVPGAEPIRMQPDSVLTPEAASVLMDKINQRVRAQQKSGLAQGTPVFATRLASQGKPMGSNTIPTSKLPTRDHTGYERLDKKPRRNKATTVNDKTCDTSVLHSSVEDAESARQAIKAQVSKPHKSKKFKTPLTKSVRPEHDMSCGRPKACHDAQHTAHGTAHGRRSPKALDILADQIVDDVIRGHQSLGPQHSLFDVALALDEAAFISKEKLQRTPPYGSPLSQASLAPLTSTLIEREANEVDLLSMKKLPSKLFSDDGSDEDEDDCHIITLKADPEPRRTPTFQRRKHPSGCEDSHDVPIQGGYKSPLSSPNALVADRICDMRSSCHRPSSERTDLPMGRSLAMTSDAVVITGDLLGMTESDHMEHAQIPEQRTDWGGPYDDSLADSNEDLLGGIERVTALPASTDTDSAFTTDSHMHCYPNISKSSNTQNINNSSSRNLIGSERKGQSNNGDYEIWHLSPSRITGDLPDHGDNVDIKLEKPPRFSDLLNESLILSTKKWDGGDDELLTSSQSEVDDMAELIDASAQVIKLESRNATEASKIIPKKTSTDIVDSTSPFMRNTATRGSLRDVEQNVLQSFVSSSMQNLTPGAGIGGDLFGRNSPVRSRSPRVGKTPDKTSLAERQLNVSDILTKYRMLMERRAANGEMTASNTNNSASSPGSSTASTSLQSSPMGSRPHTPNQQILTPSSQRTPVISEHYLQRTPTRDVYTGSKKLNLELLDSPEDFEIEPSSWNEDDFRLSPIPAMPNVQQEQNPQPSVTTPTHRALGNPQMSNQQNVPPISSMNHSLPPFDIEASAGRLSTIWNEDVPVLLPLTPQVNDQMLRTHPSPRVARLLDL